MQHSTPDSALSSDSATAVRVRVTAAWALSEGLIGGLLHALKLPVTGLVAGSAAIVCLALLGWYRSRPGQILRATLVVVIIKALLSPHAPLPAYFAVLFQGLAGELLLRGRRNHRLACVVLGTLALTESAIQRLLVLTLLGGQTIWQAANAFLSGLLEQFGAVPAAYATALAAVYVGAHTLTGLAVGWWAGGVAQTAAREGTLPEASAPITTSLPVATGSYSAPGRRAGGQRYLLWIALGAGLLLPLLGYGPAWLSRSKALLLVVRATSLLLLWQLVLAPVLNRWFRAWLERQRTRRLAADVAAVLDLLPSIRALLAAAWSTTAPERGLARWRRFVTLAAQRLVTG